MSWDKVPINATGYSLLTPSGNTTLITITQLGTYTIDSIGGTNILSGVISSTGTAWSRV